MSEINIPDFDTVGGSIKTHEKDTKLTPRIRKKSLRSANQFEQMDHFSIYSEAEASSTPSFDSLYKKIALIIEIVVLVSLLILILKKVSLFKVFNVVTAFCFPTICVITPTYYYIMSIKKFRALRFSEYVYTGKIIIIGIIIFIMSFINIFFLE